MGSNTRYPFNPDFEIAILRSLFSEPSVLARVAPHLNADLLNREEVVVLVGVILDQYRELDVVVTPVAALQEVRLRVEGGKIKNESLQRCALCVEEAEEAQGADAEYVVKTILEEARKRAVFEALESGLKEYRLGNFEVISERMAAAAEIGTTTTTPGTDHAASLLSRTNDRRAGIVPRRWNCGIPEIDDIIRGGLAGGELGVVIGAPKFGKSMFLSQVAWSTMGLGGQAFYYSLEMSEIEMLDRIDAAISRVPTHMLRNKADHVHTVVEDWNQRTGGGLLVKQLPGYETTVKTIDAHIRQQRMERSRVPSVVIVDSADFLSGDGDSRYEELGSVYIQLKGLAAKWNVPVWTASWAKRDSLAKEVVTMGDIGESFKKVGVADLGLAICATEAMRQQQVAKMYLAFCRFAPMGVMVGPFRTAFSEGLFAREGSENE